MKTVKRSQCLDELTLSDKPGCLYRISNNSKLHWFRHLMLLGSPQDKYVSMSSALIAPSGSGHLQTLADNLLAECVKLHRVSVHFQIPLADLDSLTGRAAHIKFLEDDTLLTNLIHKYPECFF